jgi:very-short-patch-repair endonuclease
VDLFAIAERQNGVVSRRQLLAGGTSADQIRAWLRSGRLHPVHRGVYAVAPPSLLPLAAEAAALLALGPGAVLGHRSAAGLWGLAPPNAGDVDVIVVARWPKSREGVRIHRVKRLDGRDLMTKHNLRLTTPARTVVDFATGATLAEVEYALSEGRALNLITDAKLNGVLNRFPANHPGAAKVRGLLYHQTGRVITRSERERRLLELLNHAGLPKPLVNHRLHGYVPDFYWPHHRLILEFDGYQTHGSRSKFESDRKRDQLFAAKGIQTIRSTWLQFEKEAVALVVRIAQALAARGG